VTDKNGFRRKHVDIRVTQPDNAMYKLELLVRGRELLTFTAKDENTLIMKQSNTFPLHPSTIKLGVVDEGKRKGNSAGGFGYGFKDAVGAILYAGGNVHYDMTSSRHRIGWNFIALPEKAKAPGLEASDKLCIQIASKGVNIPPEQANTLTITIKEERIACKFLTEVVPQCTVFWTLHLDEDALALVPSNDDDGPNICLLGVDSGCEIHCVIRKLFEDVHPSQSEEEDKLIPHSGVYCRGFALDLVAGVGSQPHQCRRAKIRHRAPFQGPVVQHQAVRPVRSSHADGSLHRDRP